MPSRLTPTPRPVVRAVGHIGQHVSEWRRLNGLTMEQVADRAGVGLSTLRRIEAGSGASLENTLRVARALGLLERVEQAFDPMQTDVGRMRALDRLPKRIRPKAPPA